MLQLLIGGALGIECCLVEIVAYAVELMSAFGDYLSDANKCDIYLHLRSSAVPTSLSLIPLDRHKSFGDQ